MVVPYRRFGTPIGPILKGQVVKEECIFSWTAWPSKMGSIGCPETSVRNYHYGLRRIQKWRRSHFTSRRKHEITREESVSVRTYVALIRLRHLVWIVTATLTYSECMAMLMVIWRREMCFWCDTYDLKTRDVLLVRYVWLMRLRHEQGRNVFCETAEGLAAVSE